MRSVTLGAIALALALPTAQSQEPQVHGPTTVIQEAAPHRSPVLAGTLSFFVPFGTGSFYAGNVTHGAIHAAVGVATATLTIASFCWESCSESEETGFWIGVIGFGANWIAGTVVAVLDANSFNRRHRASAVRVSVVPQRGGRLALGVSVGF
ncbi:MAG: hypothetical protein OER90_11950 [Gemmatimonadota bacterium]|nr:hypothetical protein [Gemmatimonadota bacterium]